ncbi:MAG: SDR family NAD(P)-dependent oxidoreductase [Caulobacteraceae bacterium]
MARTLLIVGYGPGISRGLAERFGKEGFAVAICARNAGRLAEAAKALEAKGIAAGAFPADAADPAQVRGAIEGARERFGPLGVLHWNAISGREVGDVLSAGEAAFAPLFDAAVRGLALAVRDALADLKAAGDGAVLVTNGAFGETSPQVDAFTVQMKAMGVGLANAAKHKLVGLLSERLKGEGVFVGEVMVAGAVKGTPFAGSAEGIDPGAIAEAFWKLYKDRTEIRARIA